MIHMFNNEALEKLLPPIISGRPVSVYNRIVDFINTVPTTEELSEWFKWNNLSLLGDIVIPIYERSH